MFRPDVDPTAAFPLSADMRIDARPTLLLMGDGAAAADLAAIGAGAGFRVAPAAAIRDVPARLDQSVGFDVLLLDLRGTGGACATAEAALRALLRWPSTGEGRLLLLGDRDNLDMLFAAVDGRDAWLGCEPSAGEIAFAMCEARLQSGQPPRLHDVGRDGEGNRLEQLSEEVRRLALTIERLAAGQREEANGLHDRRPGYAALPPGALPNGSPTLRKPPAGTTNGIAHSSATVTLAEVNALLQARRMRDRYLPADLFADPAWDMILDLMAARLAGKSVSVSSLCIAAAVPPTTALRWIGQLTQRGICERSNDPSDARRVFISLSDAAAENVAAWFAATRRAGLSFLGG